MQNNRLGKNMMDYYHQAYATPTSQPQQHLQPQGAGFTTRVPTPVGLTTQKQCRCPIPSSPTHQCNPHAMETLPKTHKTLDSAGTAISVAILQQQTPRQQKGTSDPQTWTARRRAPGTPQADTLEGRQCWLSILTAQVRETKNLSYSTTYWKTKKASNYQPVELLGKNSFT